MSVELRHHELDEDGEHDPSECQKCIEDEQTVICSCSCGDCCRHLIIETTLADCQREPLIAERVRRFVIWMRSWVTISTTRPISTLARFSIKTPIAVRSGKPVPGYADCLTVMIPRLKLGLQSEFSLLSSVV